MDRLQRRADAMVDLKQSIITAGKDGEVPLKEWSACGVGVKQLPNDEQGILRISIGGGDHLPVNADYCVYRGDRQACIELLEKSLEALRLGVHELGSA
jgi:hypothetical protein